MIELEIACRIAQEKLSSAETFVAGECYDLGASWIFDWYWRDNPDRLKNGYLQIDKATGETHYVGLGVPGEIFLRQCLMPPRLILPNISKPKSKRAANAPALSNSGLELRKMAREFEWIFSVRRRCL